MSHMKMREESNCLKVSSSIILNTGLISLSGWVMRLFTLWEQIENPKTRGIQINVNNCFNRM